MGVSSVYDYIYALFLMAINFPCYEYLFEVTFIRVRVEWDK